jgi:hypothetical protein
MVVKKGFQILAFLLLMFLMMSKPAQSDTDKKQYEEVFKDKMKAIESRLSSEYNFSPYNNSYNYYESLCLTLQQYYAEQGFDIILFQQDLDRKDYSKINKKFYFIESAINQKAAMNLQQFSSRTKFEIVRKELDTADEMPGFKPLLKKSLPLRQTCIANIEAHNLNERTSDDLKFAIIFLFCQGVTQMEDNNYSDFIKYLTQGIFVCMNLRRFPDNMNLSYSYWDFPTNMKSYAEIEVTGLKILLQSQAAGKLDNKNCEYLIKRLSLIKDNYGFKKIFENFIYFTDKQYSDYKYYFLFSEQAERHNEIVKWYSDLEDDNFTNYQSTLNKIKLLDKKYKNSKIAGRLNEDLTVAFTQHTTSQACRDGILISTYLRLYKIKHNDFPNSLSQLKSIGLSKIPEDCFSSGDFVYRRDNGKTILYSIGSDLKDNGGKEDEDIVFLKEGY